MQRYASNKSYELVGQWTSKPNQLQPSVKGRSSSKPHLAQFREGLVDEDEGDEEGEDLLGEARDEADQEATFKGHYYDHYEHQPEANPHPARQVLYMVGIAELQYRTTRQLWIMFKKVTLSCTHCNHIP